MAKFREPARNAPKHTGRQWNRGAQYVFDEYLTFEIGPWRGAQKDPPMNSKDVLGKTNGMFVSDGKLVRKFLPEGSTTSVDGGDPVLDIIDTEVSGTRQNILVTTPSSGGNIQLHLTDSGTTTDSGFSGTALQRCHAVVWGDEVYVVQENGNPSSGSGLLKYDVGADSWSTSISGTDDADYLFILDNNLVLIRDDTAGDRQIVWSQDGDLDDFVNAGAGNNPVPSGLGSFMGQGSIEGHAIVFFEFGAIRMSSTGQASPAFRFDGVEKISGVPVKHAVVSTGSFIYFIDRSGYLQRTTGGAPQSVGSDPWRFDLSQGDVVRMHYHKEIDIIHIHVTDTALSGSKGRHHYFVDPNTGEFVGFDDTVSPLLGSELSARIVDSDDDLIEQIVLLGTGDTAWLEYYYTVDESTGTTSDFDTAPFFLGDDIEIMYVDVIRSRATDEADLAGPDIQGLKIINPETDATILTATELADEGVFVRYAAHAIVERFLFRITVDDRIPLGDTGVQKIRIAAKVTSKATRSLLVG